jgi:nucleotide-binding universal stress UspA family protein
MTDTSAWDAHASIISNSEVRVRLERVVIGMDFSAPAEAAARWTAQHLARGAELVLVHVIAIPEPPRFIRGRFPPRETLVETARVGADKRMRELSQSLGAERIWMEIREGDAASAIADVAAEYQADIIVVGAHGERAGIWRRLGSTAEQLVRRSTVPVLLATGVRDAMPERLLVAIDDDPMANAVLQWAQFLGERYDAQLTVLHAVSSAVLGGLLSAGAVASGVVVPASEEVLVGVKQDSQGWIDEVIATAGLDQKRVRGEVTFGDPAHELLSAAERLGSDLIVMGSHASGVRSALLGSVAREVLRGASCPVLVVREKK